MDNALELLTVRETALRLGVHENTIRSYAKRGLLPDARVPGTRFHKFRASDVERLKAQRGAPVLSLTAERRTASPELISAGQLAQWPAANARDAQAHFPELVRRLLAETVGAGQVSIRTSDGVALAGDDGVAVLERQTKLLPAGRIRFEFGTDQDVKRKASKDYDNRRGSASREMAFVFATPRRWQGKDKWASDRRAEGLYSTVLVLDADDLEMWLQAAPSAHLWISERLGLRPRDAVSLETWWERFSASTEPVLPIDLFTAGRTAQTQRLRTFLGGEPRLISIEAEWAEDALGFVAASLSQNGEGIHDAPSPIIVRSEEVWDRIVATPGPGTLIPQFERPDVDSAIDSGRHVVAIFDSTTARPRSVDIKLLRPGRSEAGDAFRSVGVEWRRADRLAVLARRSMPALVRRLSRRPLVRQPSWSRPPLADTLAALMLAGRWTDQPEDLQLLSELTRVPSYDLLHSISEAVQGPDPAIRNVRSVFVFASLEEAFLEFSNRVTSDLASRWTEIATSVLLDPNPLEGLTPIERIAAQLEGRRRTYSSTLRRGIADSLALAGAIEPTSDGTNHAALVAERVVRDVLRQVVSDAEGRTWLAIVDVLPLLAEAAPDAFLSALEDDLSASEPTVGCLFQTTEDPLWLGPSSQQHHLLWALEALCWSPEHLVRAIQILARLCRFDLPRNSGNTPLSSMATVLCGWVRNTDADLSTRLQAIDACRVVDASTGWSLIKRLWPDSRGWVSPPYEPRYQLWKSNSESVPNREWFSFISGMTDRIVEWAESDPDEMPWLIEALAKVGSDEADRIIGFLEAVAARADLDDDVRLRLFEKAREIAVKHERFQTSDWAMPLERRTRLSALAEQFQPANDLRRFAYLFNWHPDLPGVEMRDHEHYSAELDTRRREALDLLFNQQDGWEQLATIVKRAEAPTQIGWTLATYEQEGALDVMFDWLSSDNAALQKAAEAWVHRHLAVQGPADLRDALGRNDVSSDGLKLFVLNVPTASQYWDALHEFPEAADIFWSTAHFEYVPDEDLAEAIEVLVERGRPWSAIAVASNGLLQRTQDADGHLPSTELIISVLRAALAQDPDPAARDQMTGYNVGTLLDYLAEADVSISDLASLEFAYFRLLEHSREPQALNLALASDPGLFVDLVRHTYRGANEAKRGDDGSDPLAEHGWWVLHAWKGFPGRREDGTLDEVGMQRWVREARLQLSELDRTDIGDEVIGQTFAYAPSDPDGIWPPQSVRDLIESIGSRDLENGVVTGRLNSRGVTTRSVYEGGSQERTLAEQHKQSSLRVQAQWPRSARILRTIADSYDRDAIQQDQKAQIDQDLD